MFWQLGRGENLEMYVSRSDSVAERSGIDPTETMVGRRSAQRLAVELPARLELGDCTRDVLVEDVSATGARLQLAAPPCEGAEASLIWEDVVCRCRVVWSREDTCGVQFD